MTIDALTVAWGALTLATLCGARRHGRQWRHYRAFAGHIRQQPSTTPEEQAEAEGWARDEGYRLLLKLWLTVAAAAFAAARLLTDSDSAPLVFRSLGLLGVAGVVAVLTHWTAVVQALRRTRRQARGDVEGLHD